MQWCRISLVASCLAVLVACSRSAPAEPVYSQREFSKRAEQAIPSAVVYVYTPGGVNQESADEHLNFIRQTNGTSDVPQVVPGVRDALERTGYETSAVQDRSDALCSRRAIPDGIERLVTLVAARGERTVQLQQVTRNRAGNGLSVSCADASEVAQLLELTLAAVP